MIIPKHLEIETVNGLCTSRCVMCTYKTWTRKPGIMGTDVFKRILEKFIPYREQIQYLTLHGNGEALLDKGLAEKVRIAKSLRFKGTGFATNCTELDDDTARDLITAGLDTIICSIDGITKKTHEAIRVGTNFDQVVANVLNFRRIRNEIGKTRIIVRFIRQEKNKEEWPSFFEYWTRKVDATFGDKVVAFEIHNNASKVEGYEAMDVNRTISLENHKCESVFERLIIRSNGDLAFCDADDNGFFNLGNVIVDDPIQLYNNLIFNYYRNEMKKGNIRELEHCKNCTLPRSRALKET